MFEFTFQYVSIISPLDFLLALSAQIFTFQYVSIISPSDLTGIAFKV